MSVTNFINRLLGRPEILPNGYPNMAANHGYIDINGDRINDVTRRINGGGMGFAPPPPPLPIYPIREEPPQTPMVPEVVNKITEKSSVRETPSTTSTLSQEYMTRWCGSTVSDFVKETDKEKKDPLILDHIPLKRFLMRKFPWILDITTVKIRARSKRDWGPNDIIYGPLEIHITVSPTHNSELMIPKIEKTVREKLFSELTPLLTCMFENNAKDSPIIIFSPSPSETILEYVK